MCSLSWRWCSCWQPSAWWQFARQTAVQTAASMQVSPPCCACKGGQVYQAVSQGMCSVRWQQVHAYCPHSSSEGQRGVGCTNPRGLVHFDLDRDQLCTAHVDRPLATPQAASTFLLCRCSWEQEWSASDVGSGLTQP